MKKIALTALVLMASSFAHAYPDCDPTPRDPLIRPGDMEPIGRMPKCAPDAIVSCAPEVVQGNVAATERTLKSVTAAPEFENAVQFKSTLAQIAAMKNQNAKVAKYFALIGIDSAKTAEVVDFVGARSIKAQWLSALERSANLSSAQADTVARELQTTLRGSLQ